MAELNTSGRTQAQLYALQMVVAALLVRQFEAQTDMEAEGQDILETALGSIRKFDLRGDTTEEQKDVARATMEALATDTISAALQSARLRQQANR